MVFKRSSRKSIKDSNVKGIDEFLLALLQKDVFSPIGYIFLDNSYDLFCLIFFCYTLIITFHQQLKALSCAVCIYILYDA